MSRAFEIVLERILVVLAVSGFAAFLVTIAIWVAQPDLIVVLTIVFVLAAWDFRVSLRDARSARPDREDGRPPSPANEG